uniref:Uncharacterized protein n=1 Tax=Acrobeloides nanus TaxID=290746 RepID=A0A914E6F9_9BILA
MEFYLDFLSKTMLDYRWKSKPENSYIRARIAVDNFEKQRKLANEKLESCLTPKSLDRYNAKFPKPEAKEHCKHETSARTCRSLPLEVHPTFAFPRLSWNEDCSENFGRSSIVANNSDDFKRIFGDEFIESRRKSLDSMTAIKKTIDEDDETPEDNDPTLIATSKSQLPMYEDLSELVLKFIHQIWPQVEKDERPFKVDLETEKYEDFDQDSIEFVADFTCEFAEMAASNPRFLGPNTARSKFFYQVPMNTPESMAKVIVERLNRKQDHSYNNLPRYKIVAHHELDTVEDLVLEKLYQSESQWMDEIAKQLQKIKNSREEEEISKGLEKIKWTRSETL